MMNIMSKIKKGLTVTLASVILISTIPNIVEAAKFKDVTSKNWEYEYVERATDLGFINGYEDNTFRSNDTLTFEQAMSLLGRFTGPTANDKRLASNTYGDFLESIGVVAWAREDIAVAMDNDIISVDEIRNVYTAKRGDKPIPRVDTSRFLVRAMDLAGDVDNEQILLTYKDTQDMKPLEMKYVSILVRAGVLNPRGDDTGNFRPKSSLKRAEMAKMLVTSYDYLGKSPDTGDGGIKLPDETDKDDEFVRTEEIRDRVITSVDKVGTKNFIVISDSKDEKEAYEILSKTDISLDGKAAKYSDLVVGQEVNVTLKRGTREVVAVEASSILDDFSGLIKEINLSKEILTIEQTVDKKTVSADYPVDKDVTILLDQKVAKFKDLSKGDKLKVKVKNGVIYDMEDEAKTHRIEGTILELKLVKDSKDRDYRIVVIEKKDDKDEDKEQKIYDFLINKDTVIYRNNSKVYDTTDLKVKDDIYIVSDYGVAKNIEAKVVKKNIKGIITGMTTKLHEKLEITILNRETKEEERYVFGDTPYIIVDGEMTNASDLDVGHYVEVLIESDEIVQVNADSKAAEVAIMGVVSYINRRSRQMTIEIESFDRDLKQYGDKIEVYVKPDAVISTIVDRKIKAINLYDIEEGDRVNIIGSYDGNSMLADTIQLR